MLAGDNTSASSMNMKDKVSSPYIYMYIYTHRIHVTGIFTYIYHKNQPNLGKSTSPMDSVIYIYIYLFTYIHISTFFGSHIEIQNLQVPPDLRETTPGWWMLLQG